MNKIKISVIIPVYNAEKYLRKCLGSVVNQSLKEVEIICVNDGSTDSSLQILEEYAQKDRRIKIINKENEGLGAARNTGIEHATGEYIGFIDSDDWIKLDAYEKLYKNAVSNNSDVVLLDFSLYDESTNEYYFWDEYNIANFFDGDIDFNNIVFNYTHIKNHVLNQYFAAWTKMYRTKFLKSYDDFYFPQHIFYEDVPFHVQILLRASRISFCTGKLYIYRVSNSDSIINSASKSKKVFDIFKAVTEVGKILNENKKMDEFRYEFFTFKIVQLTQWFDKCDEFLKKEFFELMKQALEKTNLNDNDFNEISIDIQNKYQNIKNSDYYKEFESLEKINQLKSAHYVELQHQSAEYEKILKVQRAECEEALKVQSARYEEKLNVQREEYEEKLNVQREEYEEKLKVKELLIQEIMSSNSWKLTKPLRKIGAELKNR